MSSEKKWHICREHIQPDGVPVPIFALDISAATFDDAWNCAGDCMAAVYLDWDNDSKWETQSHACTRLGNPNVRCRFATPPEVPPPHTIIWLAIDGPLAFFLYYGNVYADEAAGIHAEGYAPGPCDFCKI